MRELKKEGERVRLRKRKKERARRTLGCFAVCIDRIVLRRMGGFRLPLSPRLKIQGQSLLGSHFAVGKVSENLHRPMAEKIDQ